MSNTSEYVYCNGEGAHDDIEGPNVFLRSEHDELMNDRCEYVEPMTQVFTLEGHAGQDYMDGYFVAYGVELLRRYGGPYAPNNPKAYGNALDTWPDEANTYLNRNDGHGHDCDQGERNEDGELADGEPCDVCRYFDETVAAVERELENRGFVVDRTWGGDGVAVYEPACLVCGQVVTWDAHGELRHVAINGRPLVWPGTDNANHSPQLLNVHRDDPCGECQEGAVIGQTYGYTAPPGPDMVSVQRCDTCQRWPNDENAAAHLARVWGTEPAVYVDADTGDEGERFPGDWYVTRPAPSLTALAGLLGELGDDLASVGNEDDMLIGTAWAREASGYVAYLLELDRKHKRLLELAAEANDIAVTGENVSNGRGGFTRLAGAVMHDMASVIRNA